MDALVDLLKQHHTIPQDRGQFWFWIDEDRPAPTIKDIQRATLECFGGSMHELLSASRRGGILPARHVGMYLARRLTKKSFPAIGRAFDRDHSVAITAIIKIENLIASDPGFAARVAQLEAQFA